MYTIVVGVDGSAGSIDALRWACTEAGLHDAKVRAVSAWEFPYMYGEGVVALSVDMLESDTKMRLDETVKKAIEGPANAAAVEQVVVCGHPASVLELESKSADMLVVGARGHGGFLGLLLGSVSDQIAKHSHCPVVVVRTANSEK
jgi:nucleotide-binding universal stress UspA family protein